MSDYASMASCGGETLMETELVRLRRVRGGDGAGSVLCKEVLGANAVQRLTHERRILERLRTVQGVPNLLSGDFPPGTIVVEDPSAVPLADLLAGGRPDTARLLELALQIAGIVAAIHRAGVAHKNLSLESILWCRREDRVIIVDFSLATTLAEERPSFVHHRDIAGSLPYLAPEQTGRTGRPVDYRADLYALGATLYRMATGVLPFADTDPLQLIHDILAQPPTPPSERDPAIPRGLSRIIMRLMEKEPDRRYQSAEGVAFDLARLREALLAGKPENFPLRERDFPLKLSPPSTLVGRGDEIAALTSALESALEGRGGALLVAGAPGVGKTALINELRPMVAARRGWFVCGKFDQYRRDLDADAVRQSLRALGRLLLAEPESQLAPLREKILHDQAANAGVTTSLIPELAAVLGAPPEPLSGDPLNNKDRLVQSALEVFRAVASPERPLVLVLDDLQWAAPTPLGLVDLLMTEGVPGLFMVCAYRDGEIDALHPLTPMLSRWGAAANAPPLLRLANLSPADLTVLLKQMLRLREEDAEGLAAAVGERTGGNPYHTVEVVNALRREGILEVGESGWSWDAPAIRRYVGGGDLLELLSSRMARLPSETQALVEALACLGGEVPLPLLADATGHGAAEIAERLVPALEDGLLVLESEGPGAVSFRHDRVQQAAYGRLEPARRLALHLALGRALSLFPPYLLLAAEQHLPAVHLVQDRGECRALVSLFRAAADQVRNINFVAAERLLAAALKLLHRVETPADNTLFLELECELHATLYGLARLDEADEVYRSIEMRSREPIALAGAASLQICSLTNRGRPVDAVSLGLALLTAFGVAVPQPRELDDEVAQGLDLLERWVEQVSVTGDLERPEVVDPRILAVARLVNRMIPPAYFSGQAVTPWLVLLGQRLWMEHGPCAALVGPLSHASFITVALREDFHTGYRVVRHVLAVSEARGYEPDTSQARFLFSLSSGVWFEPLEENLLLAQRSHEGLLRGGDLQNACFTYYASIPALFECADTLETFSAGLETCLAFAVRTGNAHCSTHFGLYRTLVQRLAGCADATEASNPPVLHHLNGTQEALFQSNEALMGACFGEMSGLLGHTREAVRLLPYLGACYATAVTHLLHAVALAHQLREAGPGEGDALLAELDTSREWLAKRAADAPGTFLHMLHFVDAERSWAVGDLRGALCAFEAALAQVEPRQRPWHRALITERAALCHLAHGLERTGRHLLCDARNHYRSWGARAKVRQLEEGHPFLRAPHAVPQPETPRYGVSSDAVDMLAVLRGSQALSSETSLERLRAQVVELLGTMTGASGLSLVLWQEEEGGGGWYLLPEESRDPLPLAEAARSRQLPVAIFRYVERTREPLLVHDAKRDERFAFDPYFFPLECCSMLALPILNQGSLRAVLLLENRLSRGAFTDERLDAVKLLAGQLAVSLENALLYEKLEERVRQRTAELSAAQSELMATARQAGMAEVATNVLHNVGNVLNSVNISAGVVLGSMRASKSRELKRTVHLVKEHAEDLASFLTEDARGRLLPTYLEKLSQALDEEQQGIMVELSRLVASVDHIKEIVAAQQLYARGSSMTEPTRVCELVEDALRMNALALQRHGVTVVKELAELPALPLDRARVLQILVNLISNAKYAMGGSPPELALLTLRTELAQGRLRIEVADRGEGIAPENLLRIFSHGFTTRQGGHGFGLHSCALAAKEMGGTLTAQSDGVGQGATFTLELPVG